MVKPYVGHLDSATTGRLMPLPSPSPSQPAAEGGAESLAEFAYRRIEEMIVTRALPPGSMISENGLAEELKCGRTPVREALQRLRNEGFVEIHPRRGALVSSIDVMRQIELLEVRRSLEDLVVRLAAERANATERAEMLRLADAILAAAAAADQAGYLAANRSIHELEARAARNAVLAKTIGVIHGLSRRFWYAYIEDTGTFDTGARLHAATLRAIAAGDAAAAAEGAARLLDFLSDLTERALRRQL